jgi:hypothetical protein
VVREGGYWINHGLPQYVAIDWKPKPEAGCKIQNTACGCTSGIILWLKLVETAELESAHAEVDPNTGLLHGMKLLKFLVMPLVRTGCIICADSYFASIPAAAEIKRLGLYFIGVVKTAP